MQSDASLFSMQKGFNSDISVKGQRYHVQTEDWGFQNPYLITRVFRNGAVVRTIKTSYQEILSRTQPQTSISPNEWITTNTSETIQRALRAQHTLVVEKLVSGELS